MCEFFSDTPHPPVPVRQVPSPFHWSSALVLLHAQMVLCYHVRNLIPRREPFAPSVQSSEIQQTFYRGGPLPAGERPGRGWTCRPALPRLWYWSALPSRGARLPVISLPFRSHHLSALWIQLQGPKRATTPQLKRLICPHTAPPPPPILLLSMSSLVCSTFLWFLASFLFLTGLMFYFYYYYFYLS